MYAVETAKMSSKGQLMEESHKNLIGREFRHFKGNHYRLEGFAKDSETLEEMAVYRALYGEGSLWVIKSPVRDLMTV